eukprot:2610837-Alexandrium_andersonii.AAC.1
MALSCAHSCGRRTSPGRRTSGPGLLRARPLSGRRTWRPMRRGGASSPRGLRDGARRERRWIAMPGADALVLRGVAPRGGRTLGLDPAYQRIGAR